MERVGDPSFAQWAAECERHAGQQLNGTVRVEGSREAVPGVVIALVSGHDDVVVDAVTDSEGHFRLVVPPGWEDVAKRWRLRLCSPYGRLLFEQAVLIVSRHEELHLLIPELQLESWSPHCPDDEVRAGVSFAGPLVRSRVDGWTRIGVGAHRAGGVIGAPALPVQGLQFVLPWDADEITVSAKPTRFERVELSAPPFPVMPPVPDRGPEVAYADPVPVRAEFYRHDYPAAIARVTHRRRAHGLVFVDVEVIGARHLPERRELEVLRELDVRLKFTRNPERLMKDTDGENNDQIPRGPEQPPSFIYEKLRLPEVRVSKVVELPRRVPQRYPCIIITDNYAFERDAVVLSANGGTSPEALATRRPRVEGLDGAQLVERDKGIVRVFEELARWKTTRGARTRVVTVSEILAGSVGRYMTGLLPRDLPELIRDFLKWARAQWQTEYVLIGGDIGIVPMRVFFGITELEVGGLPETDPAKIKDPPDPMRTLVKGTVAKFHVPSVPASFDQALTTKTAGVRVPYDPSPTATGLRWYCTTASDFAAKWSGFTRSPTPTEYVILEGPAGSLQDNFIFSGDINQIPSDYYYSSLESTGPLRTHDFDPNDNAIYGQLPEGFNYAATVAVGRAPVYSEAQAAAFVDKVIAYEKLRTKDGRPLSRHWLQEAAIVTDYWSGPPVMSAQSPVTGAGQIAHSLGATWAYGTLPAGVSDAWTSWRLVLDQADNEVEVKYDATADATRLGWYYCVPQSTTPSTVPTPVANPTTSFVVRGPAAVLDAAKLWFWDPKGLDEFIVRSGPVREQMRQTPIIRDIRRLYRDRFDSEDGLPLEGLHPPRFRQMLEGGVHFLSINAHGDPNPWWFFQTSSREDAVSEFGERTFPIVFANSCTTSRPDHANATTSALAGTTRATDDQYASAPSIGVAFVRAEGRGPVAYLGNSRYGWSWVGDWQLIQFFSTLRLTRRLGAAMVATIGSSAGVWSVESLLLYGDPEMPAWVRAPSELSVVLPPKVLAGQAVGFFVTRRLLSFTVPLKGALVTLTAGWRDSASDMKFVASHLTDAQGAVSFHIPTSLSGAEITICAVADGFIPVEGTRVVEPT